MKKMGGREKTRVDREGERERGERKAKEKKEEEERKKKRKQEGTKRVDVSIVFNYDSLLSLFFFLFFLLRNREEWKEIKK